MDERPRFIGVSGLIGTGKTHLTTQLAGITRYAPIYEPVDSNPYLGDFYKDPKRWGYPMQEHLCSVRFRMHQDAMWGLRCGRYSGVVFDRTIWEDSIFAEINRDLGNITEREFQTYLAGFNDMRHYLVEPDILIYLDCTPETAKARSDHRARPEESGKGLRIPKPTTRRVNTHEPGIETITTVTTVEETGIPLDYMKRLHGGYEKWLEIMAPRMPVVRVDWEHFRQITQVWPEVLAKVSERTRFTRSLCVP